MSPVQIGLIAAGAYLAYNWWTKQSGGAAPASGGTAPSGSVTPSTSGNVEVPAQQVPGGPAPVPVIREITQESPDLEKLALMAASGFLAAVDTANNLGVKFNFHQWNYYRGQATGTAMPDPDTFSGGRSGEPVSVSDYLAAVHSAGLEGLGLGRLGRVNPSLMWIT